jgi:hypothetical protein
MNDYGDIADMARKGLEGLGAPQKSKPERAVRLDAFVFGLQETFYVLWQHEAISDEQYAEIDDALDKIKAVLGRGATPTPPDRAPR